MTASTSAALLDLLRDSQILATEELKRAESLIGNEADSKSAARRLLGAGLITPWQASQLARSRPTLSLGKYVLLDRLPWGSSHAVFLAKHPMMERKVALSVLDRNSSSSSQAVSGFLKDARSIAGLDHRNLIHVFDVDQADDRYYQVMEYVQGKNLYEAIKEDGPMAVETAADLIRQLADGLEHAHRSGLTHGGLRPSNIILDGQGTAKIIDLGVAQLDDPVSAIHSDQDDSKILGIADFLSPEQAAGESPKAASDIYSLGCVGYWLLAGKVPFGEGNFQERMQRHVTDEVPDVRKARSDVPPGLAEIISRMMAKKPGERYPTARNVVAALDKWWSDYAAQLEAAKPKPAPARPAASKGKPVSSSPAANKSTPSNKPKGERSSSENGDAEEAPNIMPVIITTGKGAARPAAKQAGKKAAAAKVEKKRAADAVVEDDSSSAALEEPPVDLASSAPSTKKSPPWLLLSVVGGVAALLGVGGAIAGYFIWSHYANKPTTVATTDSGDKATALKPPAAVDPPDNSGNKNPGTEENPPDDQPDPGSGSETPPDGGETTKPPDPPATDPPATDPPATDPPATDPPKDPPATDPPKDPPPTDPPKDPPPTEPPKDPPKDPPPAGADPFREVATALDLPAPGGEAKLLRNCWASSICPWTKSATSTCSAETRSIRKPSASSRWKTPAAAWPSAIGS
jgi:serine/threonine-protein kinase